MVFSMKRSLSSERVPERNHEAARKHLASPCKKASMRMSKHELQKECHKRQLDTDGTKADLSKRVKKHDDTKASSESDVPRQKDDNGSLPAVASKTRRATVSGLRPLSVSSFSPTGSIRARSTPDPADDSDIPQFDDGENVMLCSFDYTKSMAGTLCSFYDLEETGGRWERLGRVADFFDRLKRKRRAKKLGYRCESDESDDDDENERSPSPCYDSTFKAARHPDDHQSHVHEREGPIIGGFDDIGKGHNRDTISNINGISYQLREGKDAPGDTVVQNTGVRTIETTSRTRKWLHSLPDIE